MVARTDQTNPITIMDVDYHDTKGKLIQRYVEKPVELGPNASTRFVIKESDDKGGSGANFIVKWRSATLVNTPIIESVMVGTPYWQGVFLHHGGSRSARPARRRQVSPGTKPEST
jgi:hypothetical protein